MPMPCLTTPPATPRRRVARGAGVVVMLMAPTAMVAGCGEIGFGADEEIRPTAKLSAPLVGAESPAEIPDARIDGLPVDPVAWEWLTPGAAAPGSHEPGDSSKPSDAPELAFDEDLTVLLRDGTPPYALTAWFWEDFAEGEGEPRPLGRTGELGCPPSRDGECEWRRLPDGIECTLPVPNYAGYVTLIVEYGVPEETDADHAFNTASWVVARKREAAS